MIGSLAAVAAAAPPPAGVLAGSADELLIQIGREIPGFGGYFDDSAGRPTVYLRNTGDRVALSALGAFDKSVRVRRGDFDFEQLVAWRVALRSSLSVPGVVFLDADESSNRVVVGIDVMATDKDAVHRQVEEMAASAGVAPGAVSFVEMAAVHELVGSAEKAALAATTLSSAFKPAPGGVQITFILTPTTGGLCTLGFNAYLGGAFGFVTNSHCTTERSADDGTHYTQGSNFFAPTVASEISDPAFFTGDPCPTGRRCRLSDAAFAQYVGNSKRLGSLGKLARTQSRDATAGSLSLKPPGARFSITAVATPLVGQVVNKIGRTTGWTFGEVVATCADVGLSDSDIVVLCQTVVHAGSDHGDSGSPVFTWPATSKPNVSLAGILWGGATDSNGDSLFVFSPLANIQQELGALRFH